MGFKGRRLLAYLSLPVRSRVQTPVRPFLDQSLNTNYERRSSKALSQKCTNDQKEKSKSFSKTEINQDEEGTESQTRAQLEKMYGEAHTNEQLQRISKCRQFLRSNCSNIIAIKIESGGYFPGVEDNALTAPLFCAIDVIREFARKEYEIFDSGDMAVHLQAVVCGLIADLFCSAGGHTRAMSFTADEIGICQNYSCKEVRNKLV